MSKDQNTIREFFYDAQIERYLTQFMHIFAGLQYQTGVRGDGERKILPVPIVYGSRDRVAAAIRANNTQNSIVSVPMMSCFLKELTFDWERNAGAGNYRDTPYMQQGGIFPQDVKTIHQTRPTPYTMQLEVLLYTSNQEQHMQILEQMMVYFNPTLEIQTSDASHDWTKIVSVSLMDIRFNENYPAETQGRVIQTALQFKVPVWIAAPTSIRNNLVKDIFLRIHTGSFEDFLIDSSTAGQEDQYEHIASASGVLNGTV